MQNVAARRVIGPDEFTGVLVQCDEAWCVGCHYFFVRFIHGVGSVDQQQVAGGGDRTTGHVVLHGAEFFHHVEIPDGVGLVSGVTWFRLVRPVVLAVVETIGIETCHLAAVGHQVEPIAFDQRCAADALTGPVDRPARLELLARELPSEAAVALAEAEQAAEIDVGRIAWQVPGAVVGGAIDPAAGDYRGAVAARSQPCDPKDVFGRVVLPSPGLVIEAAHVPLDG